MNKLKDRLDIALDSSLGKTKALKNIRKQKRIGLIADATLQG